MAKTISNKDMGKIDDIKKDAKVSNVIKKIKKEKRLSNNKRIKMLGVDIDVLTAKETVQIVEKYIVSKTPLHLMGVNADKINETRKNPVMKEIVNSCGIINADGASVVLASKQLSKDCVLPERVAGIDLMMDLIALCELRGYRVYLLGAKPNTVVKAYNELRKIYPQLNICGIHNGYFKPKDWPLISQIVAHSKPDIVFVGITSPIKEYLIEFLQNDGHKEVFMGVGGSFDVISKEIKRAPKWIQTANMEWLYRVIQEPTRLFKRYFIGNAEFVSSVRKESKETKKGSKK
jgi:N-acetylglucosaminyldiphosphoundecaprenol N-acetyl-beta-D-mannosaminyltransferase